MSWRTYENARVRGANCSDTYTGACMNNVSLSKCMQSCDNTDKCMYGQYNPNTRQCFPLLDHGQPIIDTSRKSMITFTKHIEHPVDTLYYGDTLILHVYNTDDNVSLVHVLTGSNMSLEYQESHEDKAVDMVTLLSYSKDIDASVYKHEHRVPVCYGDKVLVKIPETHLALNSQLTWTSATQEIYEDTAIEATREHEYRIMPPPGSLYTQGERIQQTMPFILTHNGKNLPDKVFTGILYDTYAYVLDDKCRKVNISDTMQQQVESSAYTRDKTVCTSVYEHVEYIHVCILCMIILIIVISLGILILTRARVKYM